MVPLFTNIARSIGYYSSDLRFWFIFSFFNWVFWYLLYDKFMMRFLKKMGVTKVTRKYIIERFWQMCFHSVNFWILVYSVDIRASDMFIVFQNWKELMDLQLLICKKNDDISVEGIETLFVLNSCYYLLSALYMCHQRGLKNAEFFQQQSIFAAYVLTHFTKCSLFGIYLLLLSTRIELSLLIAKFIALAGFMKNSFVLGITAKVCCFYHVCLWGESFLMTFPFFLTDNKSISSSMMNAKLNSLIILDFILWLYVLVSIWNSVFSRTVLSLIHFSESHPFTLQYILFGQLDVFTPVRFDEDEKDWDQIYNGPKQNATRMRLKNFASAVKFVILLKRKVRNMRQRNAEVQLAENQYNAALGRLAKPIKSR